MTLQGWLKFVVALGFMTHRQLTPHSKHKLVKVMPGLVMLGHVTLLWPSLLEMCHENNNKKKAFVFKESVTSFHKPIRGER